MSYLIKNFLFTEIQNWMSVVVHAKFMRVGNPIKTA